MWPIYPPAVQHLIIVDVWHRKILINRFEKKEEFLNLFVLLVYFSSVLRRIFLILLYLFIFYMLFISFSDATPWYRWAWKPPPSRRRTCCWRRTRICWKTTNTRRWRKPGTTNRGYRSTARKLYGLTWYSSPWSTSWPWQVFSSSWPPRRPKPSFGVSLTCNGHLPTYTCRGVFRNI